MTTKIRRMTAIAAVAVLGLTGAACSDEDGDGANTDEEVGELEDGAEDLGNELEEEIDQGEEEVDENSDDGS